MCRLWGISYKENEEDLSTAQIAAILFPALVRQGPHAYGWAQWIPFPSKNGGEDEGVSWSKFPGRCDTDEALENILTGVSDDAYWVMGHTRYATTGSPEDCRNNHPIPHGDIIGMHNGVIDNECYTKILAETGREDPKTQVDSEAIFAAVDKWGHLKGLRKINGTMVSVYARISEPETIYIARSYGRQLTLGWTDRGNMIWASEKEALLQLEPDIVFTRFSTISEDRVIAIAYGDIVERRDIHPRPKVKPQPRLRDRIVVSSGSVPVRSTAPVAIPEPFVYGMGRDAAVRAYLERRQDERRQARLFPNGMPEKKVSE